MKASEKYRLLENIRSLKSTCSHLCSVCKTCELEESLVEELREVEKSKRHTGAECWNYILRSKLDIKTFQAKGYVWVWCPVFVIRLDINAKLNLSKVRECSEYASLVIKEFNEKSNSCKELEDVCDESELWFEKKSHKEGCILRFNENKFGFNLTYFLYLYTVCGGKECRVFTSQKSILMKGEGIQILLMGCKCPSNFKNIVFNYKQ